jgi:hypothetical protein
MQEPLNQRAIQATSTDVVFHYLLTIRTANNPPLYLVNNSEPVVSRGITYLPYPFALILPQDDAETLPVVSLEIANIAAEIVEAIRGQGTPPELKVEMVSSAFPDTVEVMLDYLRLRVANYDAVAVTGQLESINVLNVRFPKGAYTPVEFPGLFY